MSPYIEGKSLQQNNCVMVLHTVGSSENFSIKTANQFEIDLRAKYF